MSILIDSYEPVTPPAAATLSLIQPSFFTSAWSAAESTSLTEAPPSVDSDFGFSILAAVFGSSFFGSSAAGPVSAGVSDLPMSDGPSDAGGAGSGVSGDGVPPPQPMPMNAIAVTNEMIVRVAMRGLLTRTSPGTATNLFVRSTVH